MYFRQGGQGAFLGGDILGVNESRKGARHGKEKGKAFQVKEQHV